ncbi:MAG: MCE family protein [Deltaproteobacteria bacterium]|nr:MCE family protein [Deltaproteobacteria bacterium]
MNRRVSPTMIGAFVIGALALAAAAIVVLGSLSLFGTVYRYALYFEDSVDGLIVGAPVKFKGVQIGSVEQILLVPGEAALRPRIAVVIGLDATRIRSLSGRSVHFTDGEVSKAVASGLRGMLVSQSLLTGLLFVSLDYDSDAPQPPPPVAPDTLGYLQIPTVPSRVEQLAHTANDIFKKLQALDWQGLFDSIHDTMDGLRNLVADQQTQDVTRQLNETLASVRELAKRVDTRIDPLARDVQDLGKSMQQTLAKIDRVAVDLGNMLQQDSPFTYDVSRTLRELESAARSIRELANSLEQNPNQVIFGRE